MFATAVVVVMAGVVVVQPLWLWVGCTTGASHRMEINRAKSTIASDVETLLKHHKSSRKNITSNTSSSSSNNNSITNDSHHTSSNIWSPSSNTCSPIVNNTCGTSSNNSTTV
jgi:hypothetical protein